MTRSRQPTRRTRRRRRDGGYVIALTALLLLPLVGFTGFAVDLGAWMARAAKLQASADAAALAGVVYLPDEDEAIAAVNQTLARNGITAGADGLSVTIDIDNQRQTLSVTVTDGTVDQFFSSLFVDDVEVERASVAQFVEPVPMGSPEPYLGVDPERGLNPGFVLNIAGRGTRKENGDKRQAGLCNNSHAGCNGIFNGYNNVDYSNNGYFFTVRVDNPIPGQDLSIEIFNPAFVQVNDFCTQNTLPTDNQINNELRNVYAGDPYGATRYQRGRDSLFCTGDHRIGGDAIVPTTYIVRAPDDTPFDNSDNPPICTITFSPYNEQTYGLLVDTEVNRAPRGMENVPFYQHFRRWFPICNVPSAQVQAGDYVVQMRTNANLTNTPSVTTATPNLNTGTVEQLANPLPTGMGHNRFNMRASWGRAPQVTAMADNPVRPETGTGAYDGTGLSINAQGHFAIYQQQLATQGSFYLARVPPANAGRSLVLTFWDIADVAGGTVSEVEIIPPPGITPDCTFLRVTDALGPHPAPTANFDCTITGMTNALYNGRDVVARIPIPLNYTCNVADPFDCWFRIAVRSDNPNDTTTWSASMQGDPVRLID